MISHRAPRVLVLVAILLPASLSAQSADERIQAALNRADEVGVPTFLLETKLAEGRAKGVPMGRIADAVERRLAGLSRARQALSEVDDVDADDLSVAADALESGVSEAVLAEMAETAPRRRRAVAIAALGQLVAADVAPAAALDRVRAALDRGPEALQNLPARAQGPDLETPVGDAGPPAGVPAPGDDATDGLPAGVESAPAGSAAGPPDDEAGPPPDDAGSPPDDGGPPPDDPGTLSDDPAPPADDPAPPPGDPAPPPTGPGPSSPGALSPPTDVPGPPSEGAGALPGGPPEA